MTNGGIVKKYVISEKHKVYEDLEGKRSVWVQNDATGEWEKVAKGYGKENLIIDIFESQIDFWYLKQCEKLNACLSPNADYLLLMICVMYIEARDNFEVARFSQKESIKCDKNKCGGDMVCEKCGEKNDNPVASSRARFVRSFRRIFPESNFPDDKPIKEMIYGKIRNSFGHSFVAFDGFVISRNKKQCSKAIEWVEGEKKAEDSNDDYVKINPELFFQAIKNDFKEFIKELRAGNYGDFFNFWKGDKYHPKNRILNSIIEEQMK